MKVIKLKESDIQRMVKKVLKEEYGRNYSVQSMYDVIYDELINIPSQSGNGTIIDDFKMLMKSPIGGIENFMMPHNKSETGTSEGLVYDYDEEMVMQQGPHGLLSLMLFPKLKEMGIIKGALKDPDELKILNRIGSLFYRDIRPSLGNSSDMSGREFYDIDDEGNPINESDTQRMVKKVLTENRGMDFYLEELGEFANNLEWDDIYDDDDELRDYDVHQVELIIQQANDDESLSDNEWDIISEFGEAIINKLTGESGEEGYPTDQRSYWS